jgi:chromosome segregation protein
MDRLKERIFNAYQVDLMIQNVQAETEANAMDALVGSASELSIDEAKAEIQKIKEKLNRMGPVNLVAIEEHQEMTERYNFLIQQQDDLVKAKDELHKAILKINRTTRELFAETFAKAQEYFSEYFKILFNGGQAELVLLDEQDILESGIDIIAKPPGKKLQSISLLSGGEKALTAIALVFALFKIKPSPFCILDEIDAPLDESNVDRFCNVLKDFVTTSQFILITHNKRTMNLADAIYGITMARTGCSNVVSVKFSGKAAKSQSSAEVVA